MANSPLKLLASCSCSVVPRGRPLLSLLHSVPLLPSGGHSPPKFHVFWKDRMLHPPPFWYFLFLNSAIGILQICFHLLKRSKVQLSCGSELGGSQSPCGAGTWRRSDRSERLWNTERIGEEPWTMGRGSILNSNRTTYPTWPSFLQLHRLGEGIKG